MSVFLLFLLALAGGALTTLYWIPEEELGGGYFKVNALVVLGLLATAAATQAVENFQPFAAHPTVGPLLFVIALVGTALYYATAWRGAWRLGRWPLTAALLATGGLILLAGPALIQHPSPLPHRSLLLGLALVSSSLLLGWSLVTMLLGHWYLVVPRLSFRYLEIFCRVLLAVVVLRLLAVGASLWVAAAVDPAISPHPLQMVIDFGGQGMFFWFRVLWGLAMPLLLGWMALDCARRNANQSATGILYVLLVGSFIGDITGFYLTLSTGVPL